MWSLSRNPFLVQNYINTNFMESPWGSGTPASTYEYNSNLLLRNRKEQDIYRSLAPSGFVTSIVSPVVMETTTGVDVDGELATLTTNNVPVANTLRLGRSFCIVNGWRVPVTNITGSNGLCNDIILDAPPAGSQRVDLVFLEVWLAELGGTSASISNTANKPDATHIWMWGNTQYSGTNQTDDISETDMEINRRWQVQYRIRVVDGVSIDTYPDGVNDNVNVKAWGANPTGAWSGYAAGTGSVYTFASAASSSSDSGLYIAGDGSTTAMSALGTVDGYVYAIPLAAIFRRNNGVYNAGTNPNGCAATGPTGGLISSGISGRPDGLFADQVALGDIMSLRHQVYIASPSFDAVESQVFDGIMRGNLTSLFGVGDGTGSPLTSRNMLPMYAQELATVANLDAGFKGLANYNYQRRIFSDAAVIQQTQFTFTGGVTPDNPKPTVLSAPATPTGSTSTASGSWSATTYYVKITYVNPYGESLPSSEANFVLASAGKIIVNSPAASGNANGWKCYIGLTSGTETCQNSNVALAIGSNFDSSVQGGTAPQNGAAQPVVNTTSSQLQITPDSTGLVQGQASVKCVDGTTTPGTGNLPGNNNILVYSAGTLTQVTGTWSGANSQAFGTPGVAAIFTPTSSWTTDATTNGVIVIVGMYYPGGNGMQYRAKAVVGETLITGANTYNMQQIGVSAVAAADNSHLNQPADVVVDTSGNIYVADTLNHRVVKYNSSLVYQSQFGVTGVPGNDNLHLNTPTGVEVDSGGNVYVVDSLNHRVIKLNTSLNYIGQYGVTGVSGSDNTHFNTPYGISLDSGGTNIYIADQLNNRICKITNAMAAGTPFVVISGLTYSPNGVTLDANNNIYFNQQHSIVQYSNAGSLLNTFGNAANAGATAYACNSPLGVDMQGTNLLVSDTGNHRIITLNSNFVYIGEFGVAAKFGTDKGHLNGPIGITYLSPLIYVADANNERVLVFHPEMGACDPPLRQFEVMVSGASSDRLQLYYTYRPYQGVISHQGATQMSYTLRALTNFKTIVTTCGTGGRNAETEDNLNGFLVRMPYPGLDGVTTEFTQIGSDLSSSGGYVDSAGIVSSPVISWGGSMSTFGPQDPGGNMMSPLVAGNLLRIQELTTSVYPIRGANTLQRYVDGLLNNAGWDYLGYSAGVFNSTDHLTIGYCLAVASGGSSTLPLNPGEIVLVVVSYRYNGTKAVIYGQTSNSMAVDIYRLPNRPLMRYY